MRSVAIGARGDPRLARGHLPAVGAREVLLVLVDAHLRVVLLHVVRVGVTPGTELRDPGALDRPVWRRAGMARYAAQPGLRMHVVAEQVLRGVRTPGLRAAPAPSSSP